MKELSANDMEVWVFDTKRNPQVLRGRKEQEQLAKRKEESVMDLELDFLAPYIERYPDVNSLSKSQALEVRDECLIHIKNNLTDKEKELEGQIEAPEGRTGSSPPVARRHPEQEVPPQCRGEPP